MTYKFKMKMAGGETMEFDFLRYGQTKRTLPDGDYELIIRKAIKWDTDKMRKYFYGPVINFVVEQFKGFGSVYTKDEVKQFLKLSFGKTKTVGDLTMPLSTAGYDFDTYRIFLKDINDWCVDVFQCELPPSDEVE